MKIGLVGGYGHECIKVLPGAELAWACDGYDQQALVRAASFGCQTTFASMGSMLEEFQPDIVYIGSAFALNGALAIHALECGFDVVSEKPLATDWGTLERLASLTASGSRRVIAEFTMRWLESFALARRMIQSGRIGSPVMVQAQKTYKFGAGRPTFYQSRELFGGIIPWVASHSIDYAAWCTGLSYESVTSCQGKRCFPDYPEMEDHASMLFKMTGDVPCVMTADFLRSEVATTHGDDRLRVTGTSGTIEVRNDEVFLTDSKGEHFWHCQPNADSSTRRAVDLMEAALGLATSEISTTESLHITAAALAARDSADHEGQCIQVRKR